MENTNTNLVLRRKAQEELLNMARAQSPPRAILRPSSPDLNATSLIHTSSLRTTSTPNYPSINHPLVPLTQGNPIPMPETTTTTTPALRQPIEIPQIAKTTAPSPYLQNNRIDFQKTDFLMMERTYPEFKFVYNWNKKQNNNNRGHAACSTKKPRKQTTTRCNQLKASLSMTRLAQAMELRNKTTKHTSTSTHTSIPTSTATKENGHNTNNPVLSPLAMHIRLQHTHSSPLAMQTRSKQHNNSKFKLHLLPEDDSILLQSMDPSLLKNTLDRTKKNQVIEQYNRSVRKQHNGPQFLLKKNIRKVKRRLKTFKKRNNRYKKKFAKLKKQATDLADEFIQSRNGSRIPKSTGYDDQEFNEHGNFGNTITCMEEELSYDKILEQFAAMEEKGRDKQDGSNRGSTRGSTGSPMNGEIIRLSQRRLRSRSRSSSGSRPVSRQDIHNATTRLTRAKEQLRSTIQNNDRRISTAGSSGLGRLLARPMSKSQKIRMTSAGSAASGGSLFRGGRKRSSGGGSSSSGGAVGDGGMGVSNRIYEPPPIHTPWLGLAPESQQDRR